MTDAKHLHLVVDDFINSNIGPARKHQFAGVLGQADAPDVRKFPQAGDVLINGFGQRAGRQRDYLFGCTRQYAPSRRRPWWSTECASGLKHVLDAGNNFVMFEQFATSRRGASFLDSLDKPSVILEHAIHSFLDKLRGIGQFV